MNPKVTVLMPVYNGEKYLRESIESILNQTFKDFEFLIINDGSNDSSQNIINEYSKKDSRIKVISRENKGLIYTLNEGIKVANGEYIARMDCDDISLPERLEIQTKYMDLHTNVGICGTWIETFGEVDAQQWKYPTNHKEIMCMLLFHSCLAHPSVIMRKKLIMEYELFYDENYQYAEDWELWQRATLKFNIANLPQILLRYRITSSSISRKNKDKQQLTINKIHERSITNINLTDNDKKYLSLLMDITNYKYDFRNKDYISKVEIFFKMFIHNNDINKIYPQSELCETFAKKFFEICYKCNLFNWSYNKYFSSDLSEYYRVNKYIKFKFFIKNLFFCWGSKKEKV